MNRDEFDNLFECANSEIDQHIDNNNIIISRTRYKYNINKKKIERKQNIITIIDIIITNIMLVIIALALTKGTTFPIIMSGFALLATGMQFITTNNFYIKKIKELKENYTDNILSLYEKQGILENTKKFINNDSLDPSKIKEILPCISQTKNNNRVLLQVFNQTLSNQIPTLNYSNDEYSSLNQYYLQEFLEESNEQLKNSQSKVRKRTKQ